MKKLFTGHPAVLENITEVAGIDYSNSRDAMKIVDTNDAKEKKGEERHESLVVHGV